MNDVLRDSYLRDSARIRADVWERTEARRWASFKALLWCLFGLTLLGMLLGGCSGITPAHAEAAQIEAAALSGDLDGWDGLTDEERRASLAQAHAFAVEMCKAMGVELPEEYARDRR